MKPLAAAGHRGRARRPRARSTPKRWENVYFHWMENIRDWCISRQLWWGHRIPVFYCDDCGETTSREDDLHGVPEVRQRRRAPGRGRARHVVLARGSGRSPRSAGPSETPELDYFYPTNVLSTARDIIFLWVARMVMSGMYFMDGEIPFHDVIIHPTVLNAEGKRMSKSLGTGVDPLDLIEHYGADAVRFGLMLQVTGAQDMKFAEDKLALEPQLRQQDLEREPLRADEPGWLRAGRRRSRARSPTAGSSRASQTCRRASTKGIDTYEFGEAARALYDFFWNEFCDWYIELAKGRLNGGDAEAARERRSASSSSCSTRRCGCCIR